MLKIVTTTLSDKDVRMDTVPLSPDDVGREVKGRKCDLVQLSVIDNLRSDEARGFTMLLGELHNKHWLIARLAA